IYQYEKEDGQGIDILELHEANRLETARKSKTYLKRIKYGNRQPNRDDAWSAFSVFDLPSETWMFEAVFDYGNHNPESPGIEHDPNLVLPVRKDVFSINRPGFEIRTYRLCRRILMFHHFPDELGRKDYLVGSTT